MCTDALARALEESAEQLHDTATRLRAGLAPTVDHARLLRLAGPLLALLADVEREAHRLRAFTVAGERPVTRGTT